MEHLWELAITQESSLHHNEKFSRSLETCIQLLKKVHLTYRARAKSFEGFLWEI
jgi:hypothetical protein